MKTIDRWTEKYHLTLEVNVDDKHLINVEESDEFLGKDVISAMTPATARRLGCALLVAATEAEAAEHS